jgi:NodT family efflux transporter outer membrane factor (OMF) lipoprotein
MQQMKSRFNFGLSFPVLAALLSACVPAVKLPEQQVALPALWPAPQAGAAASLAQGDWWKSLNDSQLNQIVDAALLQNPSLQQSVARVEAARALVTRARAQGLPNVGASAAAPFEKALRNDGGDKDVSGRFTGGVDVSWELDVFGRVRNSVKGARAEADAAEFRASAAKVLLVSDIVQAYVDLRVAQTREALVARSVNTQSRLVDLVATRVRAGLSSEFELNRARTNLGQTLSELPTSKQQAEFALQRLAILSGNAEPLAAWRDNAELPKLSRISVDIAPADILRMRPDVRAAEANVLRASADVGVAVADLYPRLSLGGQVTAIGNITGNALPFTSILSSVTPSISIPLFEWGARQASVKAQQARLKEAIYAYREQVLGAYEEAQNAMVAVAWQNQREKELIAAQESAAKALLQAELLYTRGLTGLTERLDAESQALSTDLSLLNAQQSSASAVISLHKALSPAEPLVGTR